MYGVMYVFCSYCLLFRFKETWRNVNVKERSTIIWQDSHIRLNVLGKCRYTVWSDRIMALDIMPQLKNSLCYHSVYAILAGLGYWWWLAQEFPDLKSQWSVKRNGIILAWIHWAVGKVYTFYLFINWLITCLSFNSYFTLYHLSWKMKMI